MGVAGRHAKDLHMHTAITVYQGGILDEREILR